MRSSPLDIKLAAAFAVAVTLGAASPAVRQIDIARSSATFSVAHVWVENVTGTVPIVRGTVTLESDATIPEAASAVLDATRIKTDEPDRDRALVSPDFFDTAKFPHWTFTSTKIVPNGSGGFAMDGDLTMHGQTQLEVFSVTVSGTAAHPRYHAVGRVDRHAFGMTRTRLDPTIGSVVTVTLDISLN
jgi:polyisoprenoid-binding protein YceI